MQSGDVIAERFEVERLSAAGGMGRVYRARDRVSGDTVALKVLYRAGVSETERFAREAQVLATLRHPGIVRYIAYGTTDAGEPYLVLSWLDGETLLDRLKRQGLTLAETLVLGARLGSALGVVHQRGVVHRDIKPSNIFLPGAAVDQGTLIDFGIARLAGVGEQLTIPGGMLGTPGYVAPEQARGEPNVDARADVFSLGCVLFRCLTGRGAFFGDDVMSVLLKIAIEEPPAVRELRAEIPDALSDLVARMLAKSPDHRPRDGHAVAAELLALTSVVSPSAGALGEPPEARPLEITTTERRVMCLILARPAREAGEPAHALQAAVARHRAEVESLANGMWFVTMTTASAATDLASRAARCALAMRALLPGAQLAIVAGRGVTSSRLPVGEMIDRAVRLLPAEPAHEILVDEVMGGLLALRFDLVPHGAGALEDGRPDVLPCYLHGSLGLRGERDEIDVKRTLLGKPTACVGREHEVALLTATFARCAEDRAAKAVIVTAASGMGKSRLRYELLRRLREEGRPAEVLFGQGDPMSAGSAFAMLGHALRRASGIRDDEPLEVRRDKLRARVARFGGPDAARVAEHLGELVGVPAPASPAPHDPTRTSDQIRRAWEAFLRAECSAQPVILVLEDLHWGDLPTVKLVESALRNLKAQPLMVLALARPEVSELFPNLWAGRDVQGIHLGELTRKAGERLVRQVLGDDVSEATVQAIVERADGHAFYLEELIRAAAEGKGAAMPETVLAMVQARLERLDVESRRVLRAASVFGETFWRDGVSALLGGVRVEARFEDLAEQEVITRSWDERFRDQPEFRFQHALVREAAYGTLTDADRSTGHRLAGEWLERAGEGEALVLAEHFERAGEPARAVRWFARAAEHALRSGDTAAAVAAGERGLECGAEGESRATLVTTLGATYSWSNDFGRADLYLDEALRLTTPGSGRWCAAMMSKLLSALVRGRLDRLGELVVRLREVEPTREGATAFVTSAAIVQEILNYVGQFELADVYAERLERVGTPLSADPTTRAWLEYARGDRARREADGEGALTWMKRAEASFEEAGNAGFAAMVRVRVGFVYNALGAHAQAEAALRGVAAIGDSGFQATVGGLYLAMTLSDRGAFDEALAELERIRGSQVTRKNHGTMGILRWILAVLSLRRGDLAAAEQEALTARELCAASPLDHIWATATLADVRLAQGRAPEALALAERAAEQRRAYRHPHFFDACLWVAHVEALRATGDHEGAAALLSTARAELLARAAAIGDPDLARSLVTSVPANARLMALPRG
jgi:tetratricopeptide (TPR) repeat protein